MRTVKRGSNPRSRHHDPNRRDNGTPIPKPLKDIDMTKPFGLYYKMVLHATFDSRSDAYLFAITNPGYCKTTTSGKVLGLQPGVSIEDRDI
jgi:hypothetical protein